MFATGSVVSRNVSVIAAAVFAVLLLGVVQLGRAQDRLLAESYGA